MSVWPSSTWVSSSKPVTPKRVREVLKMDSWHLLVTTNKTVAGCFFLDQMKCLISPTKRKCVFQMLNLVFFCFVYTISYICVVCSFTKKCVVFLRKALPVSDREMSMFIIN